MEGEMFAFRLVVAGVAVVFITSSVCPSLSTQMGWWGGVP